MKSDVVMTDALKITSEIHALCGMKVEVTDPIVIASLLHGRLILEKNAELSKRIDDRFAECQSILSSHVQNHSEEMVRTFQRNSVDILQRIRREATVPSRRQNLQTYALAIILFLSGLFIGIAVYGFAQWCKSEPVNERELAAGRDFLGILPQLDKGLREKIESEVRRLHKKR